MDAKGKEIAVQVIGPWIIGFVLDIFLQGIVSCQFAHYFTLGYNDKLFLRLAVYGLMCITTLTAVLSFCLILTQGSKVITDLEAAIQLLFTPWWQLNPLMCAFIDFYVQAFFCYRLFIISGGNRFVVALFSSVSIFSLVTVCASTYSLLKVLNVDVIRMWLTLHYSSTFAGDILLTSTTAYFLIKTRNEVLPQTVGLFTALLHLTFQTAAPATLCAMLSLILTQGTGHDNLSMLIFAIALPKLYAISMMWTLNARRGIHDAVHCIENLGDIPSFSGLRSAREGDTNDIGLVNIGDSLAQTRSETVGRSSIRLFSSYLCC